MLFRNKLGNNRRTDSIVSSMRRGFTDFLLALLRNMLRRRAAASGSSKELGFGIGEALNGFRNTIIQLRMRIHGLLPYLSRNEKQEGYRYVYTTRVD